jgi:hypothetical protein
LLIILFGGLALCLSGQKPTGKKCVTGYMVRWGPFPKYLLLECSLFLFHKLS